MPVDNIILLQLHQKLVLKLVFTCLYILLYYGIKLLSISYA